MISSDYERGRPLTVPRSTVQFAVLEVLGRGTFAEVSRVRLDDDPAPLVLRSFHGQPDASASYQSRMRKRFVWGLQHHRAAALLPGVVILRMILEDEHEPAALLDYVDGVLFRDLRGSVRERLAVLRRLVTTVAQLHVLGMVHRDLKPDNVLVRDGQPILLDFDLAARCQGSQPTTWDPAELPITPASNYHHPQFREAFDRGQGDPRYNGHNIRQPAVDVHGLGGLLLFVLTNKGPEAAYPQTERAVLRAGHHALIAEIGAGAANHLLGLALRCLTPRLEDTPSLDEVAEALDDFASTGPTRATWRAVGGWLFGGPLRSVADLQRSYARPVLQTLRFRWVLKLAICGLALLIPGLLWHIFARPPVVDLSLSFIADLIFIVTAQQLLGAARDVGPDGSRGQRSVVSLVLRISHHLSHAAWLVSFTVLLASIAAIPWQFHPSEATPLAAPVVTPEATLEHRPDSPATSLETLPGAPVTLPNGPDQTSPSYTTNNNHTLALWTVRKDGYVTTFLDPQGIVMGTCDTIVVGTATGTWEVVVQKETQVVPDLIYLEEIDQVPAENAASLRHPTRMAGYETTVLFIRGFTSPGVVKQVVPPPVKDMGLTYVHEYEALGGYGPFIFAREKYSEDGHGAAPDHSARFHVFDLGAPESSIALYSGAVDATITRRESFLSVDEFTALKQLGNSLKDPTDQGDGPFSPGSKGELTGYYPSYPDGREVWTAQFTWPCDRGHADDNWDTYAKSTFATVPDLLPRRIRTTAPLHLPAMNVAVFRGWSWVATDDLAEFNRRAIRQGNF